MKIVLLLLALAACLEATSFVRLKKEPKKALARLMATRAQLKNQKGRGLIGCAACIDFFDADLNTILVSAASSFSCRPAAVASDPLVRRRRCTSFFPFSFMRGLTWLEHHPASRCGGHLHGHLWKAAVQRRAGRVHHPVHGGGHQVSSTVCVRRPVRL
jgi:hypothetical protein